MSGTKRKHESDSPDQVYNNKSKARKSVEGRVDPTYGQRSAIPGLDDDTTIADDELSYNEDMDALAYLRAVREEATGIPNLLVAPKQNVDEYGRDTDRDGPKLYNGYYEDGAYYTSDPAATVADTAGEDGEVESDPQLAYFDSILVRFENLRNQLMQIPPADAIRRLDQDHPTYLGKLNTEVSRWWRWKMRTQDPIPVQIACMDKSTVLRLLGLITNGALLKKGTEVDVAISRWAWGLLARLPDRGELTSGEIGIIRELGKKAVLVGMGLKENKEWDEGINEVEAGYEEDDIFTEHGGYTNNDEIQLDIDEESGDAHSSMEAPIEHQRIKLESDLSRGAAFEAEAILNGHGESEFEATAEDVDQDNENFRGDDIAAAKARILSRLGNQEVEEPITQETDVGPKHDEEKIASKEASNWNTRATVDMIITVAGEVFGQRDLLEFRSEWS